MRPTEPREEDGPRWTWRGVALGTAVTVVVASACNIMLNLSLWWSSPRTWSESIALDAPIRWLGAVLVWILIVCCVAITNRLWISIAIVMVLVGAFALATKSKVEIRTEPIYPSDVQFVTEPSFLVQMTGFAYLAIAVVVALLWIAMLALVGRHLGKHFPRARRSREPRVWWTLVGVRVASLVVGGALLVSAHNFNAQYSPWRNLYEASGADWNVFSQIKNYRSNGFVAGFLYNMAVRAMSMPDGYSAAALSQIADRYEARANELNRARSVDRLQDANVVVILSESLADPVPLEGFDVAADPLPRLRQVMDRTISGNMLAQRYGGGTANMEFEALTGQSMSLFEPQVTVPYQTLIHQGQHFPSAVDLFKEKGHLAIAIHPYLPTMYKRESVYESLGFDRFTSLTGFDSSDKLEEGRFVSDSSTFTEVIGQIEAHEEPLFMNVVTMQNHLPVDDSYSSPLGVEGVGSEEAHRIGQYSRGLAYSDGALADVLDRLRDSDEETFVVFFGDHQPGIYSEETLRANPGLAMYKTPFFIWSSEGNRHQVRPLISPIHFLPLLFDAARSPVPPLYALLHDLRQELPAMENGQFLDSDGQLQSESGLTVEAQALLQDYRLVQYDLAVGERHVADRMWGLTD